MSETSEAYRISPEDDRLVCQGDKLFAVVVNAADAQTVVDLLNGVKGPGTFTDRDGDHWIRQADGQYKMYDEGVAEELSQVKEKYGSWGEREVTL